MKEIAGKLFANYNQDRSCWNCGDPGHRLNKCRKPINAARVAANKAKFLANKRNNIYRKPGMSPTKQVLFEISSGLNEIFETTDDYQSDKETATFFGTIEDNEDYSKSETSDSDIENADLDDISNTFYTSMSKQNF